MQIIYEKQIFYIEVKKYFYLILILIQYMCQGVESRGGGDLTADATVHDHAPGHLGGRGFLCF